jgi:hypothetical protein
MPLSTSEIVNELNDLHNDARRRRSSNNGAPVLTIPWTDFYRLCKMERFKGARAEEIQKAALTEHSLIVAYGDRVVLVAPDGNFAPAP